MQKLFVKTLNNTIFAPHKDYYKIVNARMAKLVNVAVSEAVGVQSLRVRVSLRARVKCKTA
jgi:hypothetical protein